VFVTLANQENFVSLCTAVRLLQTRLSDKCPQYRQIETGHDDDRCPTDLDIWTSSVWLGVSCELVRTHYRPSTLRLTHTHVRSRPRDWWRHWMGSRGHGSFPVAHLSRTKQKKPEHACKVAATSLHKHKSL